MSQYYHVPFAALQTVTHAAATSAGELMFQVINGVVDAETLNDLAVGAKRRNDGVEIAALTLVIAALDTTRKMQASSPPN